MQTYFVWTVVKLCHVVRLVTLINELVAARPVYRTVHPQDRRALSLNLTRAGNAMLTDCHTRIKAHERRMLSVFSGEEVALLRPLLSRIGRKPPTKDW